jgi:hypothetical protein
VKVLFLDIDGVLINRKVLMRKQQFDIADTDCVALLNEILEKTGAMIVVTSLWRIGHTTEELEQLFVKWGVLPGRVIDRTICNWDWKRGQEIQAWLDEHPEIKTFAIIDDDSDMLHLMPYLVRTQFEPGLTAADASKALTLLSA